MILHLVGIINQVILPRLAQRIGREAAQNKPIHSPLSEYASFQKAAPAIPVKVGESTSAPIKVLRVCCIPQVWAVTEDPIQDGIYTPYNHGLILILHAFDPLCEFLLDLRQEPQRRPPMVQPTIAVPVRVKTRLLQPQTQCRPVHFFARVKEVLHLIHKLRVATCNPVQPQQHPPDGLECVPRVSDTGPAELLRGVDGIYNEEGNIIWEAANRCAATTPNLNNLVWVLAQRHPVDETVDTRDPKRAPGLMDITHRNVLGLGLGLALALARTPIFIEQLLHPQLHGVRLVPALGVQLRQSRLAINIRLPVVFNRGLVPESRNGVHERAQIRAYQIRCMSTGWK
ncbi:hypothetical protein BDW74DRAFT_89689 [Aspergillus multicolor]|uniref:uncharacterized protein n=1 Tax=Aspergillus multicolor TaxID=41759 RepID=UPI003CCD9A0A